MSFTICCPQCGALCKVGDDDVGKAGICGNCDHPLIISKQPTLPAQDLQPQTDEFVRPPSAIDPARVRALTRPIGRNPSPRRWRLGCVCFFGFLAAVVVLGLWMRPRERDTAEFNGCRNNLKTIYLALQNYNDAHGSFPPAVVRDESGRPMHSWRVLILPYLGHRELYREYRFDEPWDGPNNRLLWSRIPRVFRCPSTGFDNGFTPYKAVVGTNTPFEPGRRTTLEDIYDARGMTIMLVESAEPVLWLRPRDVSYSQFEPMPDELWGSNHEDKGLHVLLANGVVDDLPPDISEHELRTLVERMDGDYYDR